MSRKHHEIDALRQRLAELEAEEAIGVYQDPVTGRWYVRIKVKGIWTTRRSAPDGSPLLTRDAALVARGQWEAQASELTIGRVPFDRWWPRYLDLRAPEMDSGSLSDLRTHGAKRLLPFFKDKPLGKMDFELMLDWRAWLWELVEAGDFGPKTANNARTALLGAFKLAVPLKYMSFNPVKDLAKFKVDRVEPRYLQVEQIMDYLDCCPSYYRPLAETLIWTGARISEAIALQLRDIRLAECRLDISRQRGRDYDLTTVATKTDGGRGVYYGPGLQATLSDQLARRREHTEDPDAWLFLAPVPKRGRYAGRTLEGYPPHRRTVLDWHKQALSDAGIADMPLHALRHTAAALWLGSKQPLEFVKRQLGHSTITTTSDFYGHIQDRFLAEGAAEAEAWHATARQAGALVP